MVTGTALTSEQRELVRDGVALALRHVWKAHGTTDDARILRRWLVLAHFGNGRPNPWAIRRLRVLRSLLDDYDELIRDENTRAYLAEARRELGRIIHGSAN